MNRRGFLKGLISAGAVVALAPYLPAIEAATIEAAIAEVMPMQGVLPIALNSINGDYYAQIASFIMSTESKLKSFQGERLYTTANLDHAPQWMNVRA